MRRSVALLLFAVFCLPLLPRQASARIPPAPSNKKPSGTRSSATPPSAKKATTTPPTAQPISDPNALFAQPLLQSRSVVPPKPKPSLLFGVNFVWRDIGGDADFARGGRADRLVALMKSAGVTAVRVRVDWKDIELDHGTYDWHSTDRLLRYLQKHGFALVGVVHGAPLWASDTDHDSLGLLVQHGLSAPYINFPPVPHSYEDFGRFAFDLGRRYKDIVHRWEFWSDPDGNGMPIPLRGPDGRARDVRMGGDPVLYSKLLRIFSQNVKRADPTCLVAVGGLAVPRTDFLQALYANGARNSFDAVGLHPSNSNGPLSFDWIDACRQVMTAQGDARKKIWVSDWGWNTYPVDPGGILEGQQALLVRESIDGMRMRGFIEMAFCQALDDGDGTDAEMLAPHGAGLLTEDLRARPAFDAFRILALALPPPAFRPTSLRLTADAPTGGKPPVHIDVYANRIQSALPKIGRGATIDPRSLSDQLPALSILKGEGAPLVRITPFRANSVTVESSGALSVSWSDADSAVLQAARSGADVIVCLTPQGSLSGAEWTTFVTQTAKRFGSDPKFRAVRWELAGSSAVARVWYPGFARAVRASLPDAPVGFVLADGDAASDLDTLAAACTAESAPLDSFSWHAAGTPEAIAIAVRTMREGLANWSALKSVTLWPVLADADDDQPAAAVARIARLVDFAPAGQPNALGGVLAELPGSDAALTALAIANRLTGSRLRDDSDDSGARCMAARGADGSVTVLLWREAGSPEERLVSLRLHNLPRSPLGGYKVEVFTATTGQSLPTAMPAVATTGRNGSPDGSFAGTSVRLAAVFELAKGGDVELSPALPENGLLLVSIKPERPSPIELSLTPSQSPVLGGDEIAVMVNLKNRTASPQRVDLRVTADPAELVPVGAHTAVGIVPAGVSKAVRYRLTAPSFGSDRRAYLTVSAGAAGLTTSFTILSPIVATLETQRVGLEKAGAAAKTRIRIVNRGRTPLSLALRQARRGPGTADAAPTFIAPGNGKATVRTLEVETPQRDAGLYPVELELTRAGEVLTTLRAWVGIPASCRFAPKMPIIDGDLSDWTDAEPIGMGRRDQVHKPDWRGPADLSAYAYTKWDSFYFYFACAVTDDVFYQPFTANDLWRGDSVQFALSADGSTQVDRTGYGPGDHEFGLALLSGVRPTLVRTGGPPGTAPGPVARSVVAIMRVGNRTFYEAAIPWSALAPATPQNGSIYGFSIVVNDSDGKSHGTVEWGGGISGIKHPGRFPPLRLTR